jgi:hypothetical protein
MFACRSAMETICDSCSEKKSNTFALTYCWNCEEKLICTECAEWRLRGKVFKSQYLFDLPSVVARISLSSKINCEIHTDVQIDYICSQHPVLILTCMID